jgi:hypothetical protein
MFHQTGRGAKWTAADTRSMIGHGKSFKLLKFTPMYGAKDDELDL